MAIMSIEQLMAFHEIDEFEAQLIEPFQHAVEWFEINDRKNPVYMSISGDISLTLVEEYELIDMAYRAIYHHLRKLENNKEKHEVAKNVK